MRIENLSTHDDNKADLVRGGRTSIATPLDWTKVSSSSSVLLSICRGERGSKAGMGTTCIHLCSKFGHSTHSFDPQVSVFTSLL